METPFERARGSSALAMRGFGAFQDLSQFYQSYVLGYVFWVGLNGLRNAKLCFELHM